MEYVSAGEWMKCGHLHEGILLSNKRNQLSMGNNLDEAMDTLWVKEANLKRLLFCDISQKAKL